MNLFFRIEKIGIDGTGHGLLDHDLVEASVAADTGTDLALLAFHHFRGKERIRDETSSDGNQVGSIFSKDCLRCLRRIDPPDDAHRDSVERALHCGGCIGEHAPRVAHVRDHRETRGVKYPACNVDQVYALRF